MANSGRKLVVLLAATLLAASIVTPLASGTSSSYLTTGIKESAIRQATISGYHGVMVNYTNTYSTSFEAFVYLDLVNAGGQTVYWNVGYCGFQAGQLVQCFVTIAPTVPSGTYTAWVFATTTSGIPVSVSNSVSVTV